MAVMPRLLWILVVLAVVISAGSLVYTIYKVTVNRSSTDNRTVQRMCIKRQLLLQNNDAIQDNPVLGSLCTKEQDGNCCAESKEDFDDLFNAILHKPTRTSESLPEYDKEKFEFSRASAHKCLRPSRPYISKPDTVPVFDSERNIALHLSSAEEDPLVEHAHNVEVMTSGLRILQSGMYFVYSSIRFNPDSVVPCGNFTQQTWPHNVVRSRPNDRSSSGTILRSLHTCCDDCTRDKETSYTECGM